MVTPYSTQGVAADIQMWLRVDSSYDNLSTERAIIKFEDLTEEWEQVAYLRTGQRKMQGGIVLRMTYDGLQDILRQFTGYEPTPSAGPPYSWVFTPVPRSSTAHFSYGTTKRTLVIENYRGGGHANSTYYQGCQISKLSWKFTQNAFVELTIEFVGRGYTLGAKSTPGTFKGDFASLPTGQDQTTTPFLVLGGTTYICRSATVTVGAGVEARYDVTAIESLQPIPGQKQEVMLEAEIEVDDDTMINFADDPATNRFATASLRILSPNGSGLQFSFDELAVKSPAEPRVSGLGVTVSKLSLQAYSSAAGVASYSANVTNQENAHTLT